MRAALRWNAKLVAVAYVFLDLLCVGAGMGVPIFCILLGFPLGWYLARRAALDDGGARNALRRTLLWTGLAALFTFVVMAALWGPAAGMLFDPNADLANFGIPMILYTPKASFIGWFVLMIFISPFLQWLSAVFSAFVTLAWAWKGAAIGQG